MHPAPTRRSRHSSLGFDPVRPRSLHGLEAHPYRTGGVVMPLHELRDGENDIEIELG
jgi:hypothetical protein